MPSVKGGSRYSRWTRKKVQEQQQREQQEQEQRELEQQQQEERERQAQAQARDQEEAELQRQQQEQAQGGCHEGARQGAEPAKSVVSRRLLVLLHGEKANDDLIREAICRVRKDGHKVAVRVTYEAGDVDRLVAEALKLGTADTLVAAGGDGTVNEVVAAILRHTGGLKDTRHSSIREVSSHSHIDMGEYQQHQEAAPDGRFGSHQHEGENALHAVGSLERMKRVTMAILPMGTSNDFAATTGIPRDPYEALSLATRPECAKPIDVGLVNNRIFMNTATVGASADVGKLTSSAIKKVLGPAAFLLTGARTFKSWHPHTSTLRFPNVSDASPPPLALSGSSTDIATEALRSMADPSSAAGGAHSREAQEAAFEGTAAGAHSREAQEAASEGTAAGAAAAHGAAGAADEAAHDRIAASDAAPVGSVPLSEMGSLEGPELRPASGGESPVLHEDAGGAVLRWKDEVGEGGSGVGAGRQQQQEGVGAAQATETGQEGGARGVENADAAAAAAGAAQGNENGLLNGNGAGHEDLTEVGMASTAAGSMVSEYSIDTARAKRFADRISAGLRSARSSYNGHTPRSHPEPPSLAYLHLESKNGNLSRSGNIRNSSGKAVRVGGGWASAPPLPPPPIPTPRTPRSASMRSSSLRSARSGGSNLASREAAAVAAAAAIPPAGPEEVQQEDKGARRSSSTGADVAEQSAGYTLEAAGAQRQSSSGDVAAAVPAAGMPQALQPHNGVERAEGGKAQAAQESGAEGAPSTQHQQQGEGGASRGEEGEQDSVANTAGGDSPPSQAQEVAELPSAASGAETFAWSKAPPPVASPPSPPAEEVAANLQASATELQGVPLLHVTAANNRQIASMLAVSPNALLDDGLLDVIYLTGTPGQQVRRVLKDFFKKGWAGTRSVPCLLRVPWLEIETEEAFEWSLDGEPAAHPSTSLRLSLLHRAILAHLPDDRMLMADAAAVAAPTESKGRRRRRRVLRSLMRPGPTLAELLGSVVVFKKKRDWRKMALGTLGQAARASVWVVLGGVAVHMWHSRRGRSCEVAGEQGDMSQAGLGSSRKRHATIVQGF